MSLVRGCQLPDELYYLVERHVWAKPVAEGLVQIGITAAGFGLAGGRPIAITIRARNLGKLLAKGQSIAMVESSKWVGAVPAPLAGILLRGNDELVADPGLAVQDPYGRGWIAEMQPEDWPAASAELVTGQAAIAAYAELMARQGIRCGH